MNIIISPAKKMNVREDELDWADLPCFLSKAEELKEYIRGVRQGPSGSAMKPLPDLIMGVSRPWT